VPQPPSSPALRERYDRRQQAVIETSAALFARRGFQATSMDELSDATGLRSGGLYHYIGSKQRLLWPLAVGNERIMCGCLFNESIADERESVYGAGDQVIALAPNGEPPFALVNPGNGNVKLRPSQPLRFPMYQCLAGEPFRTAWQADGLSIRLDLQAVEPGEESCLFEGQVVVTGDARSGELPIKGACGC